MSINPDSPDPREEHKREWGLVCDAHKVMEDMAMIFITTMQANGMTLHHLPNLLDSVADILSDEIGFSEYHAHDLFGEGFRLTKEEVEKLRGTN